MLERLKTLKDIDSYFISIYDIKNDNEIVEKATFGEDTETKFIEALNKIYKRLENNNLNLYDIKNDKLVDIVGFVKFNNEYWIEINTYEGIYDWRYIKYTKVKRYIEISNSLKVKKHFNS